MQEKLDKGPSEDLATDGTLEILRCLVPSEVLVIWATWTGVVHMIATLPTFVHWRVWGGCGLATFCYVLTLKCCARASEVSKDCKLKEGTKRSLLDNATRSGNDQPAEDDSPQTRLQSRTGKRLAAESFVSMVAALLLSAGMGGVDMEVVALKWALLVLVPGLTLFALVVQCVLRISACAAPTPQAAQ